MKASTEKVYALCTRVNTYLNHFSNDIWRYETEQAALQSLHDKHDFAKSLLHNAEKLAETKAAKRAVAESRYNLSYRYNKLSLFVERYFQGKRGDA